MREESKLVFKRALEEARAELKELLGERQLKLEQIDKLRHLCHNLDVFLLPTKDQESLQQCYIKWFPDSSYARRKRKTAKGA